MVEELMQAWHWRPIPGCPGRFVFQGALTTSIEELVGALPVQVYSGKARDRVAVVRFPEGGLITYCRHDGTLLHTLNTEDGFRRKIGQLAISLEEAI